MTLQAQAIQFILILSFNQTLEIGKKNSIKIDTWVMTFIKNTNILYIRIEELFF